MTKNGVFFFGQHELVFFLHASNSPYIYISQLKSEQSSQKFAHSKCCRNT